MMESEVESPLKATRRSSINSKRNEDMKNRFKTDQNFNFHNPFLVKSYKKANGCSRSSSKTTSSASTFTYDLSVSDDSDDSAEPDNVLNHTAHFEREIKNEIRSDWISYMNSSSTCSNDETQSLTCSRIKTRTRSIADLKPFDTHGELRNFTKLIFLTETPSKSNQILKYLDIDEPYSKSISNRAFYLDAVKELSSLVHSHRQTLFTSTIAIKINFASAISIEKSTQSCDNIIGKPFAPTISIEDQYINPMKQSNPNSNHNSPKPTNRSNQSSNLKILVSELHSVQASTDSSDSGDTSSTSDGLFHRDKASPNSKCSNRSSIHSNVDELQPAVNHHDQLLLAIASENVDLVSLSLQHLSPETLLSHRDPLNQRTLLHLACEKGSAAIVQLLLDFNFDLNILDNTGKSCLHLTENAEVVKLLCEKGANHNILDFLGQSPLHGYVQNENKACIEAILSIGANPELLTHSNRWSCLLMAASVGSADIINLLISSCPAGSIRFDRTDVEGNTALHLAASCDRSNGEQCKAILLLIHRGVSLTAKNKYGQSVLHLLCANRSLIHSSFCEPTIEMLLNMDADPNCQDQLGCTPLAVAVVCRAWPLCWLLLDAGADLNLPFNLNSPFLATLQASPSSNGTKSPKNGNMELNLSIQKKTKESDCTANDLLPRSVRKDMYSRIIVPQTRIPLDLRDRCMNCAVSFEEERERMALESSSSFFSSLTASMSSTSVKFHCSMCSRVVCDKCSSYEVNRYSMPEFLQQSNERKMQVCSVCYGIIKERGSVGK